MEFCEVMQSFNYTEDELLLKDFEEYVKLTKIVDILNARKSLRDIQVSTYKVLKEKARDRSHRELVKTAYPESFKRNIVKLDDVNI